MNKGNVFNVGLKKCVTGRVLQTDMQEKQIFTEGREASV